jgi:hypothetical protein
VPWLAGAWLAGASIYLAMIGTEIAAGTGLYETLQSALFGKVYARNVLNVVPGRRQVVLSAAYLVLNFPTPALLLLVPGFAALRSGPPGPVRATVAMLLVVHLVWAVRYDVADQYTFFIPSIVLLAVVIGLGAHRFLQRRARSWRVALVAAALMPAVVYVPLPDMARRLGVNLGVSRTVPYRDEYAYFLRPWITGYRGAEHFAREADQTVRDGAVLFADGTTARPIHYRQLTGAWRHQVRVYPPAPGADRSIPTPTEQVLQAELAARLVYAVTPQAEYCPVWLIGRYTFEKAGPIYRVAGRKPD